MRPLGFHLPHSKVFKIASAFFKKNLPFPTLSLLNLHPNKKEEIIKQTMDKELKVKEKKLLLTDKNYTLTREQSQNWVKYAVIREFSVGMPWEGTEEKKQKQGTDNARLAYILHVY
jgi:hypothetical protein